MRSLGSLAVLALLAACQREPACFRAPSASERRWIEASPKAARELLTFEAFVFANAPKGREEMLAAVQKLCGELRAPDPGVASTQWFIFRETSDTPRTVVFGGTKHNSLDIHQDDLILDLIVDWNGCRGRASYSHYPDGYGSSDWRRFPPLQYFEIAHGCEPQK
jgi:hypothetical protein